ncbi:glycoside hydrolase family 79 protein [Apiospora kogelbergensis]|uniref:Glycoside hydrolase family 79 protein n=1 Tax=Apiospora kogelbergensis TaxID=1337665 RepID=A0AAW0RC18_9PEZI
MRQSFTVLTVAALLGGSSSVDALPSGGSHQQHHKRAAHTQTLQVPGTKPTDAAAVPADFLGLNIESAFLNNYANTFSQNLVSSLASRMAAPPIVRVGGTSGDEFVFDPAQPESQIKVCVEGECPNGSAASYKIGPAFFEGYKAFPDARITIQAPQGPRVNGTLVREFVRRAWDARAAAGLDPRTNVEAIALGNEVEFYDHDVQKYVKDALELEDIIIKELELEGNERRIFEGVNSAKQNIYDTVNALEAGLNKNNLTKWTAEHEYQIFNPQPWNDATMQKLMLSHKSITDKFDKHYLHSLRASHAEGIPYAISETAAVLASPNNHFVSGFGFALWVVDYSLALAARGVGRVNHMAGRPVANHVLWVPDATGEPHNPGPQARAPLRGGHLRGRLLEACYWRGSRGGSLLHEIDLDREAHPYLSAYAVYGGNNKLQRMALVNMRLYNGTAAAAGGSGKKRTSETFRFPVGDAEVKEVKVRRLRADLGAAAMGFDFGGAGHNVTWAGEQWSKSVDDGKGHFPHGGSGTKEEEVQTVKVEDGIAAVEVPDSEAVIVSI